MIYTSPLDQPAHEDTVVHLWLEDMVEDAIVEGKGAYLPEEPALCGHDLREHWDHDEEDHAYLEPAKEAPMADSLTDLLTSKAVCEECKTRAAVYYDVVDEAALWAKTSVLSRCSSCDVDLVAEILGVKGEGLVKRRTFCPLCDYETEDEVRIPEEVEYGTH